MNLPVLNLNTTSFAAEPPLSDDERIALSRQVRELARERRAVILAHNYQVPEVQDVADFVGDSLGLAREAARTDAQVIAMCGVYFMAETAKILNPEKTVLMPDPTAGCSLADSITAEQVREWKAQHPGAVVVSYVNTTAAVKAESDYCVTSGNAEAVVLGALVSCPTDPPPNPHQRSARQMATPIRAISCRSAFFTAQAYGARPPPLMASRPVAR